MIKNRFALTVLIALPLVGCATVDNLVDELGLRDAVAEVPAVKVKPELDYSTETPDCATAAMRLADNVQVGMSLDEVVRLVGKPRFKVPGSWWWSASFSEQGVPVVKFQFGAGTGSKPVTSFGSESDKCKG